MVQGDTFLYVPIILTAFRLTGEPGHAFSETRLLQQYNNMTNYSLAGVDYYKVPSDLLYFYSSSPI